MKRKTITTICMMLLLLCFCTANVSAKEDSKAVAGKKVFTLGAHTYISEIVDGHAVVAASDGAQFELTGKGMGYTCVSSNSGKVMTPMSG